MTNKTVPAHLKGYESLHKCDPLEASRQWFREARLGLFVHHALCSLIERGKPGLLDLLGGSKELLSMLEKSPAEIEASGFPDRKHSV